MQPYPHHYRIAASARAAGDVTLTGAGLPPLASNGPTEFDGPGDRWSPETLLCAALGDCFVLTFRAVARASRIDWLALECDVEGTLERPDKAALFTAFAVRARLTVPAGTDVERAKQALEKSERGCLISSSLSATKTLAIEVIVAQR